MSIVERLLREHKSRTVDDVVRQADALIRAKDAKISLLNATVLRLRTELRERTTADLDAHGGSMI